MKKFLSLCFIIYIIITAKAAFADFAYYMETVKKGGSPDQLVESLNQLSYAGYKSLFWNFVRYLDYTAGEKEGGTAAPSVRKAAAEALGRLKDNRAIPFLIERYNKEKSNQVKSSIIYGLSFYRDNSINPVIDDGLSSTDDDVRYQSMMAAIAGEKKDAAGKIKTLFSNEKDGAMKITEVYALYALGDDRTGNEKLLVNGLKDKDPVVRFRSVDYISRLKMDSAAVEISRAMEIENKWWVRIEMDKALAVLYKEKRRKREEADEKMYEVTPVNSPAAVPSATQGK